jgi:hypothetical protein
MKRGGHLPGMDAVYRVPHVLAPKHCGAEGHQNDHSRRTVESEHGSVYLDTANLQQKASLLYSHDSGFVQRRGTAPPLLSCTVKSEEILLYVLYKMSHEGRLIFWEIIVSVILSKNLYTRVYMRPIPNGFRDRAISLYSTLYTAQTSTMPCPHTSCKVH